MAKVILDTDILSEYLKEHDPNVLKHGDKYAEDHTKFTFTSVTVYEMAFGLEAKGATEQLKRTLEWLSHNEQILPTEADYLTAAHVKAEARKRGSTVELSDCLIAAVAARIRLPLVTGNTSDFQAIKGTGLKLTLLDWRKPYGPFRVEQHHVGADSEHPFYYVARVRVMHPTSGRANRRRWFSRAIPLETKTGWRLPSTSPRLNFAP
jgi:predicted nucleic acid-binding protein